MTHTVKRILILVPDLKGPIGGVANYYKVLRLDMLDGIDYLEVNRSVKESKAGYVVQVMGNYLKYLSYLVSSRYDVIHSNPSLNRNSFYRDSLYIILAHLFGAKTIVFFRGWDDAFEEKIRSSFLLRLILRAGFAKADKIIVLGSSFRQKLMALGVSPAAHFVSETTIADDTHLSDLCLERKHESFRSQPTFLFLARIVKEKGIYIVLDAFKNLARENSNIRLQIAGDGPELSNAKKYVVDNGIAGVSFLGAVHGAQKRDALLNSHILFYPTYYQEGLPNSILEGMLYGMPIISRSIAGIPDIVSARSGFLGLGKAPQEYEAFARALLNDHDLYKSMSAYNYQLAVEKFTKEKVRNRLLSTYATLP